MLESEESQSLKVYWESLRNGSEVPRRADFRPEKITHLLSRIMIMEWLKTDYLSIRLAGTFFSERLGYDPTGKSAIDYFPDETADIYKQFLTLVTVQPCACNITFNSMLKTGATVQSEFQYLPMLSRDQKPIYILSAAVKLESARGCILDMDASGYPKIVAASLLDIGYGMPDLSKNKTLSDIIDAG